MTIFSIVLIVTLLIFLFLSDTLKSLYNKVFILAIILDINIGAGYFFKLGSNEFSFSDVITGILVIISLIILIKVPLEKKVFITIACLITVIIIGVLFLIFIPYNGSIINSSGSWDGYLYGLQNKVKVVFTSQAILMITRVMIFTVLLLVNESIFTKKDWNIVIKYVLYFSKFSIIWGAFEWITKNMFNTNIMNNISNTIFGIGGSTYTDLILRDDAYAIMGFSREPSGYAITLAYIAILIMFNVKINNDNILWLYASLALLFLSMSLSSIILGIMIIIISALVFEFEINWANVFKITLILIAILGVVIYILNQNSNDNYYMLRLKNSLKEFQLIIQGRYKTGIITSEKVRIISIVDTFKVFLDRPLLGIGIGTANSHSSIISILSNIGIIGFFYWLKTIKSIGQSISFNNFKFNITLTVFLLPFLFIGDFSLLYSLNIIPIIAGIKIVYNQQNNYKTEFINLQTI